MPLICVLCHHRERPGAIHPHRSPIVVEILDRDVLVQYSPVRGQWKRILAGQSLCLIHPRLDAQFEPTVAMTPSNSRWDVFCKRLEGPEGCNFRKVNGETVWNCKGGNDQSLSRKILAAMGFSPKCIEASCRYFASSGGFCDCEVLFNVCGSDAE